MSKNKRYKRTTQAQAINNDTWIMYYNWLKLIALNIVKWENVPPSIDVRFLELSLFERGKVVFFEDDIMKKSNTEFNGVIALPANWGGTFNIYGIPKNYYAYSPYNSYQNRNLNSSNSVLCFNNYLRLTSELQTQIFANKLYEIERTIDVNVKAQKTPTIFSGTQAQKLTMMNLIEQYDGNEPFMLSDNAIDIDRFKVWKNDAPFVADKLESLKHNILNDYLSCFGIENSNADKKERMVTDEVNANYGLVEINRSVFLRPREEAVYKINKMFGTEIKVSFNSDLRTLINADKFMTDEIKEGENIE